jgi:hypothetical protein
MQFYSLRQPTMLGFLTRLFIVPEGLWLNYCFYYSKSLFSASMHCTPSTTSYYHILSVTISNTTHISTDRKHNATTAVLRNTCSWQNTDTLACTKEKVNKQNVQSSTQRHILHWLTLSRTFCMTCCHKCKICTQTVRCGQNVKFDLRFGRKPVSSLTGLLQVHEQSNPL